MFNAEKIREEDIQVITDYEVTLYSISAGDSLFENNPSQYDRLIRLSNDNDMELLCEIDGTETYFDPEDVGEGDIIRISLSFCSEDQELHASKVHFADVFVTSEGIRKKLGVVIWFPDEDHWG